MSKQAWAQGQLGIWKGEACRTDRLQVTKSFTCQWRSQASPVGSAAGSFRGTGEFFAIIMTLLGGIKTELENVYMYNPSTWEAEAGE